MHGSYATLSHSNFFMVTIFLDDFQTLAVPCTFGYERYNDI
jgi:hypothetical protein